MQTLIEHGSRQTERRLRRALTLIELLVSVAIMTVIIGGLYAMFNHTQKALRSSVVQVDVLESGRGVMEMISRELSELAASGRSNTINLYAGVPALQTVSANASIAVNQMIVQPGAVRRPLVQLDLDQSTGIRTNMLQELFFLNRHGNHWQAVGYRVLYPTNALGQTIESVGTLYRFTGAVPARQLEPTRLPHAFLQEFSNNGRDSFNRVSTNLHRVAEGVIHLRVTAFDREGTRFSLDNYPQGPRAVQLRPEPGPWYRPQDTRFVFEQDKLPAYIELELGILEPEAWRQFLSLTEGSPERAEDFLRKQAGKVHLFRQRIPVRNASLWP